MVGEHKPRQFPLCDCGIPAICHRPSHNPLAWPVCTCGARSENHRVKHLFKGTGEFCNDCKLAREKHISNGPSHQTVYKYEYVGIDGEGIGRKPHKYVMLCAATTEGQSWYLENVKGLRSRAIFDWLLEHLDGSRVFSYGFGYDITCIIRNLPDKIIYRLLRPSLRYERGKLRAVSWGDYSLNWLQGKLTIARSKRRVAIWDILKFFQQSFVESLKDWGILTEGIEAMKARRSQFIAREMPKMRDYCLTECRQLAELARKLIAAHKNADLTLKSYYGPGSTASTALGYMNVLKHTKDAPDEMRGPIARAFFGGWFEHSYIGVVQPVYSADISSAYPYYAYQLPCLRHGKWTHTTNKQDINNCTTALVHYEYRGSPADVWAPFPHRDAKGSICHPYRSEGWTWLPEFLAAKGFGRLTMVEAWVYNTSCSCHPFKDIADYYRRRVELGKDACGRVFKTAINSVYGKLAQSKGPKPKYQNWIWAGLITSGPRAQILRAIRSTGNPQDILGIATDGIFSRKPLRLESPVDTGTDDLPKPLGGWELKDHPEGMLFLKPGVYYSLDGTGTIKARGVGRRALSENREAIIAGFNRGEREFTVEVDRFHGAKSAINERGRRPRFGQWGRTPIRIRFECPNRNPDMSLFSRDYLSEPYDASVGTLDGQRALWSKDIEYDQP